MLQAWAWSPRWSKGGEWVALISLLFPSHLTTTETLGTGGQKMASRIALSLSARPPCIRGSIKLSRQSVANKQALPCWPTAPSFPLQVSGHVSLTVQSLLTQTGELPNTRWLDSCANPLVRPLLQAWAWSLRWSKGGEWVALISILFPSNLTTAETLVAGSQKMASHCFTCPPTHPAGAQAVASARR